MDLTLITRIVEGALLASNQPLTLAQLHALFPDDTPVPPDSIERALELLHNACAERSVELVEVASGFRFQLKTDVHAWVTPLWTERKTKYSRATLETLALIAYRQPITRGEIEQVRGVAVNSNIIHALEEREWIRVVGHRDAPGKPALFGTTKAFLDYFGLKRLDELPPLADLKDIGELEPQLPLDSNNRHTSQSQIQTDDTPAESNDNNTNNTSVSDTTAPPPNISPQLTQDVNTNIETTITTDSTSSNRPSADTEAPDIATDLVTTNVENHNASPFSLEDVPGNNVTTPNQQEDNAITTTSIADHYTDSDSEIDTDAAGRSLTP
ncbi:SMC-Scp complex subunit ScpB [Xylella taiwanensis]|uniref:SMC-Scp complex subunit ScpB n=1 Tax=Xylella taiwanensis TaxID=1444770 RepID=Z9JI93_9GAMM|nr:SMC-Scp complex subunit ScpB [Xylella taiwanensis]EWS77909.1 segregation and condensation protein B [Xylella taiwanensis]MCD8456243.1 SMC-Scp complex subunit ScpB [Xylella taiwanensis]MCD8458651.1 SMC-Scp complex subunit ScpB [Xylella taiwanensis]MCD8460786.1 SMC-Scp complex subunit ScpB [Xylella taiwanensis]MCD8463156.1 SMC-Scp complex subunit ScpB [Xylella taiwanensis]